MEAVRWVLYVSYHIVSYGNMVWRVGFDKFVGTLVHIRVKYIV